MPDRSELEIDCNGTGYDFVALGCACVMQVILDLKGDNRNGLIVEPYGRYSHIIDGVNGFICIFVVVAYVCIEFFKKVIRALYIKCGSFPCG